MFREWDIILVHQKNRVQHTEEHKAESNYKFASTVRGCERDEELSGSSMDCAIAKARSPTNAATM